MRGRKLWLALAGGIAWAVALAGLLAPQRGLEITYLAGSDPPTAIFRKIPSGNVERPLILVAHGFASSERMMRGFALTLAHAGYDVVAWDSKGHGRNPHPFPAEVRYAGLLNDAETALAQAQAFLGGGRSQVAILGHSMGSGVALDFGKQHPETAATIAVSPVWREVSPKNPPNLLLLAGAREPRFIGTAGALLADAGGEGGSPQEGTARSLRVIPGVEHIAILFSPRAHAEARAWLDGVFGRQPSALDFHDRRPMWFGLGIVGALLIGWGLLPGEAGFVAPKSRIPGGVAWLAPGVGAVAATGLMSLAQVAGVEWSRTLGLLVGGFQMAWFGLAGLLSLALLGFRLPAARARGLALGLAGAGVLWLGVGVTADHIWAPSWPILGRALRFGAGAALCFPWFLAVGITLRRRPGAYRILGWLYHTGVLVACTLLSIRLIPGLGVLALALPMMPLMIALLELASARWGDPWSYAVAGSLFIAWALSATFPIV